MEYETLKKEGKAPRTLVGDVQYVVSLAKKVTVQHQTPRGEIKNVTPTCSEKVIGTTHDWVTKARLTTIGHVLIALKTRKRDSVHQTSNGDLKTLKRD